MSPRLPSDLLALLNELNATDAPQRRILIANEALSQLRQESHPLLWAQLHEIVASEQLDGLEPPDLEAAISHFGFALSARVGVGDPADWADSMNLLAIAYFRRREGNPSSNIEQAISLLRQVMRTCRGNAAICARTSNHLGILYRHRIASHRGLDMERALVCYRRSLRLRGRDTDPIAWATTLNNLAAALEDRLRGDRAENLDQAIRCYERALEVRTRADYPLDWALTLGNLGNVLGERIRGARRANIERAIGCYCEALTVLDPESVWPLWAATTRNLAATLLDRIGGDRSENLEQALSLGWSVATEEARLRDPALWASAMNNLAVAYTLRSEGDRAENLERGLACCMHALEERRQERNPAEWAQTQANLAMVYGERLLGDQEANLEMSLRHYTDALSVVPREGDPRTWASIQDSLGNTYLERAGGRREENLESAITAYRSALDAQPRDAAPLAWAQTCNNLGAAFLLRIAGERDENLASAERLFEQALDVRTPAAAPVQWAQTQMNLANLHAARAMSGEESRDAQSQATYGRALGVLTLESHPRDHRRAQHNLGDLHFAAGRWDAAYAAYTAALEAGELLQSSGATVQARHAELREVRDLWPLTAYCLARMQRLTAAVATLERGKARALTEVLQRQAVDLSGLAATERQELATLYQHIDLLEGEARAAIGGRGRGYATISADLREARGLLATRLARILADRPGAAADQVSPDRTLVAIGELGLPVVYLLVTGRGSLAILVMPIGPGPADCEAIWLDGFTAADLEQMLFGVAGRPGYLQGTVGNEAGLLAAQLNAIRPILADRLIAPVERRLVSRGDRSAVLIPSGNLNLLPLCAATDGALAFGTAPSARALLGAAARLRASGPASPSLVGIADPLPREDPLTFAAIELTEVTRCFAPAASHVLVGDGATAEAVRALLPRGNYIHLACHGQFDPRQPLESALLLAQGGRVRVGDLLDGRLVLSGARLAVLSACQSAIGDYRDVPDEAMGLPAGFLAAGVAGVIGTLWPVADLSTALLLARFYEMHLVEGDEPAVALGRAQRWLQGATVIELRLAEHYARAIEGTRPPRPELYRAMRYYRARSAERPFAHPYFWAGFVFVGA